MTLTGQDLSAFLLVRPAQEHDVHPPTVRKRCFRDVSQW